MRVLLELGRLLLANAAGAASRRLHDVAERLSGESSDGERLFVETEDVPPDAPFVPAEAVAMFPPPPRDDERPSTPPLVGSLADRGPSVNKRWVAR